MHCQNADVEGTIKGKLVVDNLLTLKATARIDGEVTTGKLAVEPGAEFNATCSMQSGVKNINDSSKKGKSA